ncbi:MAG: transcription antitermination factor NusB [Acidobacteria bacterium]|nr:transcription antitermination factor NusB [Acidobacteriota bacterium]
MPSRHRSRQRALQILYQVDVGRQAAGDAVASFYETLYTVEGEGGAPAAAEPAPDDFMEALVRGTTACAAEIDGKIAVHSEHWRIERMPSVDRNILRMAIFEMMRQNTPPAVVIDEALELARRFSGDESVPFINGVLDAVRKELQEVKE